MPTIFETCAPRPEILAGQLPDSIFAADLWDVVAGKAHPDYAEPGKFFLQTFPTQNLKLLLKDVAERLAGITGANPVHYLETGFGGGKTHALIASVHVAREGEKIEKLLSGYGISLFPKAKETKIGVFVGENADPLNGIEHVSATGSKKIRTFTPWGQLAWMIGGADGYETVRENDDKGVAPSRDALEKAMGRGPALILVDELVLYMARSLALPEDHPRFRVNSQWPTFLQTLFSVAEHRPCTAVILTLPSDQDANRRLTKDLQKFLTEVQEIF